MDIDIASWLNHFHVDSSRKSLEKHFAYIVIVLWIELSLELKLKRLRT